MKSPRKKSFECLNRGQRVRKDWVFKFIFEHGTFTKGSLFNLWTYEDKEEKTASFKPSLGVIVGKKAAAKANVRNLWKRRMREVFRKNQGMIKPRIRLLLQARQLKTVPAYQEMVLEFEKLMKRNGCWL